jgi:nicotinate phosphoribosyltransferase
LDSGDLIKNSRKVRQILDREGLSDIKVFASGNLDEYSLEKFAESETPIDGFGVGTLMITSADAPYIECGYKLVSYNHQPRFKKSPRKATYPCAKQVYRHYDDKDTFAYDEVTHINEKRETEALLNKVMENGRILSKHPSLSETRQHLNQQIKKLPLNLRSLEKCDPYLVEISDNLKTITAEQN